MSNANFADLKVLIIDDIVSLREHLEGILKELGFTKIDHARDGADAVKKACAIKAEPYNVIMCDINMPEMNGIEFVKNIRGFKAYARVPIIMVSTESEVNVILEAIAQGANDYILKPAEKNVLAEKLDKVL